MSQGTDSQFYCGHIPPHGGMAKTNFIVKHLQRTEHLINQRGASCEPRSNVSTHLLGSASEKWGDITGYLKGCPGREGLIKLPIVC